MSKPHDGECLCDECCMWYLEHPATKLSPRDSKIIADLLNDPNPEPNNALKMMMKKFIRTV